MVYLSLRGAIYVLAFDIISVHRSFPSYLLTFIPFPVFPVLFLFPLSRCQAFGSETPWSITTRRCISSISSFCFVKHPPNQCLVFRTYGLDNRQQLPSVLVREPAECRINSQSHALHPACGYKCGRTRSCRLHSTTCTVSGCGLGSGAWFAFELPLLAFLSLVPLLNTQRMTAESTIFELKQSQRSRVSRTHLHIPTEVSRKAAAIYGSQLHEWSLLDIRSTAWKMPSCPQFKSTTTKMSLAKTRGSCDSAA